MQMTLDLPAFESMEAAPLTKLERAFWTFHRANPHVYEILARLAREWVVRKPGHRLGIAALYERMRWEVAMTTSDPHFKLNNNHKAYYARLLMKEPDLDGLFTTRELGVDHHEIPDE